MTIGSKSAKRLAVVIPALNESASIDGVVKAVLLFAQPIVVDDGSSDQTGTLARQAGAEVVRHPESRGYDKALESGMLRASDLGFEFVVTMDADGQHRAELLPQFLQELERGAKVVVGVRDRRQRFAEMVFSAVTRTLWDVHDPLCGMKGYSVDVYRAAGRFDTYGSIGTELTLRACRTGLPIAQIAVPTRSRTGSARFGAGLRPNLRILSAMIRGLVQAKPLQGLNAGRQRSLRSCRGTGPK